MSTINELRAHVGKVADYSTHPLTFSVQIHDLKIAYGVERALVTPLMGSGQAWVNLATLRNIREAGSAPAGTNTK